MDNNPQPVPTIRNIPSIYFIPAVILAAILPVLIIFFFIKPAGFAS